MWPELVTLVRALATANNKGVGEPSFKVAPVTKDGQAPAAIFNFHKSTKFSSGEDFY